MDQVFYDFDELSSAPLQIDAVYCGGKKKNIADDPLHVLFPGTGNLGGFRFALRKDKKVPAYIIIYTSMNEIEWPDYLDINTGLFRYYGDNRKPGNNLLNTKRNGNKWLQYAFGCLNSKEDIKEMPPFLVFQKSNSGRDVKYLGLAAPGNNNLSPDNELVAIWRTIDGMRFQNYEAHFTILDTKEEVINREWLNELVNNHDDSLKYAPKAWRNVIAKGRQGIKALKAPKSRLVPSKKEQLPNLSRDKKVVEIIRKHYSNYPQGFEKCAVEIIKMIDSNFQDIDITRPWRDGGRDAMGKYCIGPVNNKLPVDFSLEAKCYAENNAVGVKEMSRLISRIRYRQFGVFVTTSYVHSQAYKEVIEDGHPILIISARDIAEILRTIGMGPDNVESWLNQIDNTEIEHLNNAV